MVNNFLAYIDMNDKKRQVLNTWRFLFSHGMGYKKAATYLPIKQAATQASYHKSLRY